MAFPVSTFHRSAFLDGQTNGKLAGAVLEMTAGQAGGATVTLVKPAARAWRALCAAALAAGHTLKVTGPSSSYRLYDIQVSIFRTRYTTQYLPGRPSRSWGGQLWYQRPGTAVAAVPGTSNHGWASAVDTGEERDSDLGVESLDDPTLQWLVANEQRFGWSHEVQSEPWHLRYNSGDSIPAAVLAYEQPADDEEDDMFSDDDRNLLRRLHDGLGLGGEADAKDQNLNGQVEELHKGTGTSSTKRILERLDAIEAKLGD